MTTRWDWTGLSDQLAADELIRQLNVRFPRLSRAVNYRTVVNPVRDFDADPTGARLSTAALLATIAAAEASLGSVEIPAGTYLTDADLTIHQPIRFRGDGMSAVTILRTNLAGPIVRVTSPVKGVDLGGFTTRFMTAPGATDTAAVGLQLDSFYSSRLSDVQCLQSYIGLLVPGDELGAALFFSNTIDNLVLRDVYQSFLKVHVGATGANTGNHWGNIYCNGRNFASSVIQRLHGPPIQLSTMDGETFTQLNVEYAILTAGAPYVVLIERGAVTLNGVHLEGLQSDTMPDVDVFGIFPGAANKVALVVNGMQYNAMNFAALTNWANLVRFHGDNIAVELTGTVEKQGGSTFGGNGIRPAWTGGNPRANCSLGMRGTQATALTMDTTALLSSTAPIAHIDLYGSATLDFSVPAAVPGLTAALTLPIAGAAIGDPVRVTSSVVPPAGFLPPTAWISAPNTVSVAWPQLAGAPADPDGAGATYTVTVTKQ